jgi:pimeloyl-ACP methyl ester carboxylesterase
MKMKATNVREKGIILMYSLMLSFLMQLPVVTIAGKLPGIPEGWSDGYVYANGIRLHYYHAVPAPGKPVIVMVHGVTDIGLSWTTLTWKLQGSYGNTLVKDVVEFVRVMKFDKPILMGHSMGAATVMRIGAEYPDLAKAVIMLDPGLSPMGPPRQNPGQRSTDQNATPKPPPARDQLPVSMLGAPENLVAQNNYNFEDLVATCHRSSPKWDSVDCQYWALSKKQYHGAYSNETWQAMSGTMRTGESLAKIPVPALILKADASAEQRKTHTEAVKVMQKGKLVHIDGSGHNLHHDQLQRTVEVLNEFLSKL